VNKKAYCKIYEQYFEKRGGFMKIAAIVVWYNPLNVGGGGDVKGKKKKKNK
jgi:hypothetical protein